MTSFAGTTFQSTAFESTAFDAMSTEELGEGICLRAGRIASATAELLAWIAEFDRREGWGGPGLLSCAHWLSWRIGLGPGAAREQVRVARRLEELPAVAGAFAAGRMSYSQARAITRVAQVDDGVDWPDLARHASGAQIEKVVRGIHRAQAPAEADADPERAEWKVRTRQRYDRDGNLVITITTRPEYGPVLLAGLAATRGELDRESEAVATGADVPAGRPDAPSRPTSPTDPTSPTGVPAGTPVERPRATDGDALLVLAQQALAAERQDHPDIARRRRPQLTPQVDPLSGWARQHDGELLPPATLRSIMRSLPGRTGPGPLRPIRPADLRRHDQGRRQRQVGTALRELLGVLDGERCRFPGCTRHRRLHAHHVRYWSGGGATDLDNLVLVCSRHHTLIHQLGIALVLHPDRRLDVRTADGTAVLHHPAQPWGNPDDLDPDRRVTATTLPADHCDARLDLGYVVSVLVAQAA